MTIFYFTSTGNSLSVAKRIGGTLISIPQIINNSNLEYSDDVIGIVFPIYGFFIPKMVRIFLSKARLSADYIFAVGTYGNLPGACMCNMQKYALKYGNRIDYAESLLMVDNYLPGFNVKDQIAKLPEKKTEENLLRIIYDIKSRKKLTVSAALGWKFITAVIQTGEKLVMKGTQAQGYTINDNCTKCGICAKVCPSNNIFINEKVTFSDECEWCLGCVHLCPQNAIHIKSEKSAERWLNPDTTIADIIASNNRTS